MSVHLNFSFPSSSPEALDRVVEAYGFSMKMQLADHLGIAASSLSSRYKRDVFPSDIILQCALETGANIYWLVTGQGDRMGGSAPLSTGIDRLSLISGNLENTGKLTFDFSLLPDDVSPETNLVCIKDQGKNYIVDKGFSEIQDGYWLVEIEGKTSFRTLARIPVKKLRVSTDEMSFDCGVDDIQVLGKVVLTIS